MTVLRTAADAKRASRASVPLARAPAGYSGTLDAFAAQYVLPNLPTAESVGEFHAALSAYLSRRDALYLLRYLSGTERRQIYTTMDGTRFKATDNAPAWWIHAMLFEGHRIAPEGFADVIATIPTHFHDVAGTCAPTANEAGWHVAHIFDVKDGNTNYSAWRRPEVIARCVRNVHPCNYFLIAKPEWQRWGADERVIGYFAALYADHYKSVWPAFLQLADVEQRSLARVTGDIRYAYGSAKSSAETRISDTTTSDRMDPGQAQHLASEYRASRLTFKRDVIEPLEPDDAFRVVTPLGTFEMTKADFYRVFPNVRKTRSYRETGTYNYASLPIAAEEFRKH